MKTKYWLCKRKEIFFSFDSTTGKRESLHTGDREAEKQIIRAMNDAATQPAINISIAKAYLIGTDPKLVERTWVACQFLHELGPQAPVALHGVNWATAGYQ